MIYGGSEKLSNLSKVTQQGSSNHSLNANDSNDIGAVSLYQLPHQREGSHPGEGSERDPTKQKAADKIAHMLVTTPLKTRVGMDWTGWDLVDSWVGVSE